MGDEQNKESGKDKLTRMQQALLVAWVIATFLTLLIVSGVPYCLFKMLFSN